MDFLYTGVKLSMGLLDVEDGWIGRGGGLGWCKGGRWVLDTKWS